MNIICIKFSFLIAEPWLPSSTWSRDKNHVRACVFSVFMEWIQFEWLDEMGSKFWFQNTCEKVKSNFWNRNKNKIKKVPFFKRHPVFLAYTYIHKTNIVSFFKVFFAPFLNTCGFFLVVSQLNSESISCRMWIIS